MSNQLHDGQTEEDGGAGRSRVRSSKPSDPEMLLLSSLLKAFAVLGAQHSVHDGTVLRVLSKQHDEHVIGEQYLGGHCSIDLFIDMFVSEYLGWR